MEQANLLAKCSVGAAFLAVAGFGGVWAFNKRDGALLHSDATSSIFGVISYVGIFAAVIFLLAALLIWAVGLVSGSRRR